MSVHANANEEVHKLKLLKWNYHLIKRAEEGIRRRRASEAKQLKAHLERRCRVQTTGEFLNLINLRLKETFFVGKSCVLWVRRDEMR